MSIQDNKYLKQNSRENSVKMFFPLHSLFAEKKKLSYLINNVYTIHILDVFLNDNPTSTCIMSVYANDTKMDSVVLNQQRNLNMNGKEYEKVILNPLAKVIDLTFKLTDFENNSINVDIGHGNVCILIRNFEPQTEFNDNYNELNPQYNPHIMLEDSSSSDEED